MMRVSIVSVMAMSALVGLSLSVGLADPVIGVPPTPAPSAATPMPVPGVTPLAAPAPAAASASALPAAHTGPPPVQIYSCTLQMIGNLLVGQTGQLQIQFTNESNVVADVVRFKIDWGNGKVAYIRDAGTFSPGITIKHNFRHTVGTLVSPIFSHPHISCGIAAVNFTDGTSWFATPGNSDMVSGNVIFQGQVFGPGH
ncbi:MAG: hypothetical protein ACYDA5_08845 [Vulcanimicrobiaceae bacterium]